MKLFALKPLALAAISFAVACSDVGPRSPEAITSLPRALTSEEKSIIAANNAFALALFQKASAAQPQENVFLSPLSASMALGMALNGARTTTFDAMRSALQLGDLPQGDINTGYQSLMSLLLGLDPTVESRIANSVWYRNTLPVNPAFTGAAAQYFDAQVEPLDFAKPTESLAAVNGWVNEMTSGRIPTILDAVKPEDMMYLVNAIYFKARWRTAFDRNDTKDEAFTNGHGTIETVPMMHLELDGSAGYAWADGTVMAELPYGNTAYGMQIYLPPDTSTVGRFVARLALDDLPPGVPMGQLHLWMPRLTLEYERRLNPDLAALGMGVAFTDAADFSGITTPPEGLRISDVLQKTFLSIDEDGTEAAAATEVTFVDALPQSNVVRCDRPYVIVIRERLSGTIVFIGKINTI